MPKVFANAQVAHVWAAQSQDEGRSSNGNFSFSGTKLYSYSTIIGRFVETVDGRRAVLLTSETFSKTTSSKHMPALRHAIYGRDDCQLTFTVPFLGTVRGMFGTYDREPDHAGNLQHFVKQVEEAIARVSTIRVTSYDATMTGGHDYGKLPGDSVAGLVGFEGPRFLHTALYTLEKASEYATAFGLELDVANYAARIVAANQAFADKVAAYNDPKKVAKRAADAAKREAAKQEAERQERARNAAIMAAAFEAWKAGTGSRPSLYHYAEGTPERLAIAASIEADEAAGLSEAREAVAMWLAGGPRVSPMMRRYLPADERADVEAREAAQDLDAWRNGAMHGIYQTAPDGSAYIRARGDLLETSQGASVPLAHAVKVFRFVKAIRAPERGTEAVWQRNGQTVRVGHFQVDAVYADGSFRAGCHRIGWAEIERLAGTLGLLDAAPSTEALEGSH